MSTTAPARKPGRIAAVASAVALLITAVFAAGVPAAVAGGSSGATATVTPTTTTTSTATAATFKISNTKTTITKITITAPKGLAVTLGAVQSGWTSSLTGCGATSSCVATYTATATKYGVGNGANGNVSFGLNFTAPASATTLSFVVKGKAGSDDYYLNKTLTITVKGAVVPSSLALSGLTAPNSGSNYVAGTPVTGTVTLKDTNGNPIAITDTTKLSAPTTAGAGTFGPVFTLNGDGTAKIAFTYTKADTLTFTVGYNTGSTTLSTSPATTLVYVAAAPTTITVGTPFTGTSSSPVTTQPFTAGETVTVPVSLKDTYGNLVTGLTTTQLGQLSATKTSGAGSFPPPTFAPFTGATAAFTFTDTKAPDTIAFKVGYSGVAPALSSPLPDTQVAFKVGAPNSIAIGTPYTGASVTTQPFTAGDPVTVPVLLYDAHGNLITDLTPAQIAQFHAQKVTGAGEFIPSAFSGLSGASAAFSFSDTTAPDTMTFSVSYPGVSPDATESVDFTTGAVDSLTVGTPRVGSSTTQPFAAGSNVTVPVSLYDAYGNLITPSSSDLAALSATGPGTFSPSAFVVDPSGDASATFTFTDTKVETQQFDVSYNAIAASNNPTSVEFTYGTLSLVVDSIDNLTNPGSSTFYSGNTVELNFIVKDQFNNRVPVDGSSADVTVSAASSKGGHFIKTGGNVGGSQSWVKGYYDVDESNVVLTVTDTALSVSGDFTQTFLKQIAVDDGTFVPGVPAAVKTGNTENGLDTCTGTTSCGWADLPNGANGFVSATITGNTLDISGANGSNTFKDSNGHPLYSNSAPLPVTFVCGSADCPTTSMPNNNGGSPNPLAAVGSTCTTDIFYPYGGPYTGTVFNYGASGKYCLFDAPSERVDFAQAFPFSYQLAGQSSLSPLTSSCVVAGTDGLGRTIARPIGALNPSVNYPNATTIPDVDVNGNPLRACLNVGSIQPVIVNGGSTSADYYLNFQALFADDITLRLR